MRPKLPVRFLIVSSLLYAACCRCCLRVYDALGRILDKDLVTVIPWMHSFPGTKASADPAVTNAMKPVVDHVIGFLRRLLAADTVPAVVSLMAESNANLCGSTELRRLGCCR